MLTFVQIELARRPMCFDREPALSTMIQECGNNPV